MTLVLTEVSAFGVAMAADSSVRTRYGSIEYPRYRILTGYQKLQPVYQIHAGISCWGKATVNNEDTDVWLARFIDEHVSADMSLWHMAEVLAERLNHAFGGPIVDRMGFHVAGFDKKDGLSGPAFYHVHNGHYKVALINNRLEEIPQETPPIREFRAHEDHPPRVYNNHDFPRPTRNGDFPYFAYLYDATLPLFDGLGRAGLLFPHPNNLASRGEYLRFWIDTLKKIYRLSNLRERIVPQPDMAGDASIGGPISVLTISHAGIASFYSL